MSRWNHGRGRFWKVGAAAALSIPAFVLMALVLMALACAPVAGAQTSPIDMSPRPMSIGEGGTRTLTVTLDQPILAPEADPTVSIAFTPAESGRLSFSPNPLVVAETDWAAPQSVTVSAIDNGSFEGDVVISVVVNASSPSPDYDTFQTTLSVTVNDDEVPPTTVTTSPPTTGPGSTTPLTSTVPSPTPTSSTGSGGASAPAGPTGATGSTSKPTAKPSAPPTRLFGFLKTPTARAVPSGALGTPTTAGSPGALSDEAGAPVSPTIDASGSPTDPLDPIAAAMGKGSKDVVLTPRRVSSASAPVPFVEIGSTQSPSSRNWWLIGVGSFMGVAVGGVAISKGLRRGSTGGDAYF